MMFTSIRKRTWRSGDVLFREVERNLVEVKQHMYVDDSETSGKFKQQEAEVKERIQSYRSSSKRQTLKLKTRHCRKNGSKKYNDKFEAKDYLILVPSRQLQTY